MTVSNHCIKSLHSLNIITIEISTQKSFSVCYNPVQHVMNKLTNQGKLDKTEKLWYLPAIGNYFGGDWTLGCAPIEFSDFSNVSSFPNFLI